MDLHEHAGFELLDDAPQRGAPASARPTRPELWLGLALLLLVALFGGGDWAHNQARLASYRAAQRYAQQNQWDAAQAAFIGSGGYEDASQRADDAARRIGERDSSYARAVAEAAQGAWAGALRDWGTVQSIEPGFRDSVARRAQAVQQVAALALSGTVALRPAAQPPGLYWYTGAGWIWLAGSDSRSQVRGTGSACCVVYDVPAAGASVGPAPGQAATSLLAGRRLMAARNSGAGVAATLLAADPTAFDAFTWDADGVLALHYPRQTQGTLDPRLVRVALPYAGVSAVYQPYTSTLATPVAMPAAPGAVLAMTLDGTRQVVADYTLAPDGAAQTRLYLANFHGDRVLLAVRPAVVQAAWLSPDGRYLLFDEFSVPSGAEVEEHRLMVLALDSHGAAIPATRMEAPQPSAWATNWYTVQFINAGIHAGKALVRGNPQYDSTVRLIDPGHAAQPVWSLDLPEGVSRFNAVAVGPGLLLTLTGWSGGQLGDYYVDPAGLSRKVALAGPSGPLFRSVWQHGDRVVYALADAGGYGTGMGATVRSVPVRGLDSDLGPTAVLYAGDNAAPGLPGAGGRLWAAGPGLLAYIRAGQLRAATYDGAVDVPLDADAVALYSGAP